MQKLPRIALNGDQTLRLFGEFPCILAIMIILCGHCQKLKICKVSDFFANFGNQKRYFNEVEVQRDKNKNQLGQN